MIRVSTTAHGPVDDRGLYAPEGEHVMIIATTDHAHARMILGKDDAAQLMIALREIMEGRQPYGLHTTRLSPLDGRHRNKISPQARNAQGRIQARVDA